MPATDAASVAGAKHGIAMLWVALVGAVLNFTLNEGLARCQLATGTTLLEGWVRRLPRCAFGNWSRRLGDNGFSLLGGYGE